MQPLIEAMKAVVAMTEAKCKRTFTSYYSTKLTLMPTVRIVQEVDWEDALLSMCRGHEPDTHRTTSIFKRAYP